MKIDDFISYEQPAKYIVGSDQYVENGKTPVLTAGQSFILGYTDEKDGIYNDFPVVIFDDFTTSVQYVDFLFKVKSSAMKILKNKENANIKYCYYLLSWLQEMPPNHKRQWISTTSQIDINLPSLYEQEKIVKKIEAVSNIISNRNRELELFDDLIKARFVEMFGDPIRNTQNRPTTALINVVKMQRGFDLPVQDRQQDGCVPVFGSNGALDRHNIAKVRGGGVITGRSGTIGKVYYTNEDYWPLNTSLFSVDTHGNDIIYLAYLLRMFDLSRFTEGTGVPTLNRNKFHNEPIVDIPLAEQKAFAAFVEQTDKSKVAVQKALDETQLLFDSLMQKYFG